MHHGPAVLLRLPIMSWIQLYMINGLSFQTAVDACPLVYLITLMYVCIIYYYYYVCIYSIYMYVCMYVIFYSTWLQLGH